MLRIPSLTAMSSVLLAQGDYGPLIGVVIFIAVLVISAVLGGVIARSLRMREVGWKIGLILGSVSGGAVVIWQGFPPDLGVDLEGGVNLVYDVDLAETQDRTGSSDFMMDDLVEALGRRLNPSGTKEIVIRPFGETSVEIIIPKVGELEIARIKREVAKAGLLEFRIVADATKHRSIIDLATRRIGEGNLQSRVRNDDGDAVGEWVTLGKLQDPDSKGIHRFKYEGAAGDTIRDGRTKQLIQVGSFEPGQFEEHIEDLTGHMDVEVLLAADDGYDVTGGDLGAVSPSMDENGQPCVNFTMVGTGSTRFGYLTANNRPELNTKYKLGIVLDGQLLSAPVINETIQNNGRISGGFTMEEVNSLVRILRAGKLPAILNKEPASEHVTGAILGIDTIRKGAIAIGVSLALVLVFILAYYRFAGLVACLALIINIVLILGLMILIDAALTLPGIAGLVLTVGMSVDANVLIFERIREELLRGAALRMAIRNGFSRATTTIVDANLTTLITAIVLYFIGTDQIRGFAVTLILGILMSMFTAIFCARVVFEVGEKSRRLKRLGMLQILGATQIDFIGKRYICGALSVVIIAVGLSAVAARGKTLLDIDFLGGSSAILQLNEARSANEVRQLMADAVDGKEDENGGQVRFTVSVAEIEGKTPNTVWKIDTSLLEVDSMHALLKEAFEGLLVFNSMQFEAVAAVDSSPKTSDTQGATSRTDLPPDNVLAMASPQTQDDQAGTQPDQAAGNQADKSSDAAGQADGAAEATTADEIKEITGAASDQNAADQDRASQMPESGTETDTDTESTAPTTTRQITEAEVTLSIAVELESLRSEIVEVASNTLNLDWDADVIEATALKDGSPVEAFDAEQAYSTWRVRLPANVETTTQILTALQEKMNDSPVFLSSSNIGGQVAAKTQTAAVAALLASLLGIVGYIWIRFQRVVFGLAAVVALVHDVLVTLGAIAASFWLADYLEFLKIDQFRISLPVIAAFLTIIGYSLNDTIVVFDRIREVRGKSPELTGDMINLSINQTLSRTLLTSMTTLIVVLILYWFGGQGIHGFAFALVVGVLVGTYSSIFVASPALLWMLGVRKATT